MNIDPDFFASSFFSDSNAVSIQSRKLLGHASRFTGGEANEAEAAKVLSNRELFASNRVSLVPIR